MHYYKRHIGDYSTKAGRLSILQHGVYTLLIDSCYDRERFPTLDEAIDWVWASSKEEIEAVEFVLRKFFDKEEDGTYSQKRIKEEIDKYHKNAATNKRIAQEREAKRKENSTNREQIVNEAPPNHEPLTNNQEPCVDKAASTIPPTPHKDIIELYHQHLPNLPKITISRWAGSQGEKDLRARWKEDPRHQTLEFWEKFFIHINKLDFYFAGNGSGDYVNWEANLKWLLKRRNFDNTIDRLRNLK